MGSGNDGPDDFGPDPLGDFLARFLGTGPGGQRSDRHVDFGRLMSETARHLVSSAASYAAEHGSTDLDTEHLLRAALTAEPTRTMVARAGADPDRLAADIDRQAGDGPPRGSVAVTPAVKRALLDAHEIARARGSSYIGPEHVLIALAANRDSTAGQILHAARFEPRSGPPAGGLPPPGPAADQRPVADRRGTPTLDEYGRDLTDLARPAVSTR
jgi:ATP-dependent Clp protease ATP-binding subunit ClpC